MNIFCDFSLFPRNKTWPQSICPHRRTDASSHCDFPSVLILIFMQDGRFS